MMAILEMTTLTIATIFALGAAAAIHWIFLQMTFRVMRPAAARKIAVRPGLGRGTVQLSRAFGVHR
jgi:hypothetical protein